jgi:hypothetical protein
MSVSLKQLLDEAFKDVKFDVKLAKAINSYQLNYVNRNQEHLEFFGSNLLGVHVIRFKDSDVMRLFDDVLKVDYYDITDNVKDVVYLSSVNVVWTNRNPNNLPLVSIVVERHLTELLLMIVVKDNQLYK